MSDLVTAAKACIQLFQNYHIWFLYVQTYIFLFVLLQHSFCTIQQVTAIGLGNSSCKAILYVVINELVLINRNIVVQSGK
jgi:hypothetical protein